MLRHFKLETACHEETWDLLADEDYQLFNNLLSEKCPIIMNNLLNGNFRDMYCCETFKVEEKTK